MTVLATNLHKLLSTEGNVLLKSMALKEYFFMIILKCQIWYWKLFFERDEMHFLKLTARRITRAEPDMSNTTINQYQTS